ncbi:MAG: proline racemase family protein [Deltaproteobacteria bacterium]|nr:proline racemase family protein [Deltaproteobacteria bacterium]MBW2122633.1 proline racemase family protein [Deltaproteobacteria bacterium]
MATFIHTISVVDTHTAGEPTRIVLSGLPTIHGATMAEKKKYMAEHLDHFRALLMEEPRGHRDMFGAILTPPTTDRGQYGVVFMDNTGYLDMCGHGIIGITTALIEMGMIPPKEPETVVALDTPAGLVEGHARIDGDRVVEVSLANVSSFLYARDVELDLPEVGRITIDVSFGGNFFAMTPAKALGVSVQPENISRLIHLGMMVKQAVNEKVKIEHPTEKHITTVELTEIYDKPDPSKAFSKNVVIFGDGQVDRSPCGTGTSAAMATLYGRGKLALNEEFTNESIIGTRFRGRLVREARVGDFAAVDPVIKGEAYITGIHQFLVDPRDPVKYGFTVGRRASSRSASSR